MNIEERIKSIYLNDEIVRCVIKYNKLLRLKEKKVVELNELFKVNNLVRANEMRIN
jgi:hypothetical protein